MLKALFKFVCACIMIPIISMMLVVFAANLALHG